MIDRFRRSEKGTSMVELALIAPVLIFLVIGVIEVGRYMYFGILAAHAAETGAKYGAQNTATALDTTGIKNAVLNDGSNLDWHVTSSTACSSNGAVVSCPSAEPPSGTVYYVTVQVTGNFKSLLNYPGIPTAAPVSATATVRISNQ